MEMNAYRKRNLRLAYMDRDARNEELAWLAIRQIIQGVPMSKIVDSIFDAGYEASGEKMNDKKLLKVNCTECDQP